MQSVVRYSTDLSWNIMEYVVQLQWPRGLRRESAAACLLGLWVGIPPGIWVSVFCVSFVLSGRGRCDGLITCPGSPTDCGVS